MCMRVCVCFWCVDRCCGVVLVLLLCCCRCGVVLCFLVMCCVVVRASLLCERLLPRMGAIVFDVGCVSCVVMRAWCCLCCDVAFLVWCMMLYVYGGLLLFLFVRCRLFVL